MLRLIGLPLLLLPLICQAQMQALAEDELQAVSGQAGISLGVSLNFASNPSNTRCAGGCGARVAFQPGLSDGVIVLDNIQGRFSFQDLTLDVMRIGSGYDGEGAQFNQDVLKVGLNTSTFEHVRFTLAGSNQAIPGAGFTQTDLLHYQTDGNVRLQGSFNFFATP